MYSTVCVFYLHNEVLLKIIMISLYTDPFFHFLRNKKKSLFSFVSAVLLI